LGERKSRVFTELVKAAKLQGMNSHTLRHTAASHMVMAGIPLGVEQEIMRHKTIAMTLRYAHLSPESKRSAVDALQSALAGSEAKEAKTA
jgi:site-specific recombinase XerD